MAAQALYLKYRPQTFEEVVGQEPITRTLRNALHQGRVRHAYLFAGPRGTGKTTTARLLAKAVNCSAPEDERPCNACPICVAISEGRLLDLIEIDAASNRGIDEIRDIREKVGFRPNEGRFKVYVLDEAHMLTEPAFNALLKTLEEPPPHVIFVLVTTDPHKIPATISSRCQRFDFRRIALQAIIDRLVRIAEQEGLTVEPAALQMIAQQGTGAMRDAISLLDQLASYGDEVTLAQVQMVLGSVAGEAAGHVATSLADGDVRTGLNLINRTVADGADPRQFGREVVAYLRGLLLVRQGAGTRLLNATAEQAAEMEGLAGRFPTERLLRAIRLFNEAATDLRSGLETIPQLPLEMALVESVLGQGAPGGGAGQGRAAQPQSSQPQAAQPQASQSHAAEPQAEQPQAEQPQTSSRQAPGPGTPRPEAPGPTAQSPREMEADRSRPALSTPPATKPEPSRVAERPVQPPAAQAGAQAQAPGQTGPRSGQPSLEQLEEAWDDVLQAVRRRNPATQGVLNTGCRPVEVSEDEIVITFPYPFLREKLGDPQRKMEIQDALSEVLQAKCRLRLVLAAEYIPRQQAPPAPALDDQALDQISRWAEERGGQAKIVQP